MTRGLYPIGEGACVGVVFFRMVCGVQEPIFGKSNSWSGSLIDLYHTAAIWSPRRTKSFDFARLA